VRILVLCLIAVAGCDDAPVVYHQPDLLGFVGPDLAAPVGDAGGPDLLPVLTPPTMLGPASTLTECLAVDGNGLYWADAGPPRQILKLALAGGAPVSLATGGDDHSCVVIDSLNAYWVEADRIMKAPLAGGGSATQVASGLHVLKELIAVRGGQVYFITDVYGSVDAYNGKNALVRVPTGGGAVEVLSAIVNGNPGGLAVDDSALYYSDYDGVWAWPLAGSGARVSFGMSVLHANPLAIDGAHLVMEELTAIGQGDVAVMKLDGTGRTVVSPALAGVLAVDSSGVYARQNGSLVRFALDGSGTQPLAWTTPHAIALDPSSVYFTDGASILKVGK
jgi:hypothetical protein